MEGQIISVQYSQIIAVIVSLVSAIVAMVAGIVYVYKRGEAKNKVITDLTRSFVESTKDHAKALENNTRVIEKLPDTIMLHIKANRK